MDLKILLSKDGEDRDDSGSYSMVKEMNAALQMHIRQLLEEKKEIAELARKMLENSEEEKRLLETKLQEIATEAEASQCQRAAMNNTEEMQRAMDKVESDKQLLKERKAAFNKKLARLKEMNDHFAKREANLKEIDLKIRAKQKKLIANKQKLEEEWKNLEAQKLKLTIDIKDIEHQWSLVESIKKKLMKAGNKIKIIKCELQEQCEATKRKTSELEATLSEYKAQLLLKEEIENRKNNLKQKEEEIEERERNLRKDREGVVSMRLRMKEELRFLNMQRRNLEELKAELEPAL
eukprot:TRINITY_DN15380_c0_g1_i3.p1 TRINITY_DN15380_c0_g1~~TRINITY_DN15380_c0_g1_i3.p1  ORF type:complete len:293 (+),score=99.23 TRINITY_DN15380_c0_g1_i3:124-1002(+)